jgi:hypothetical protein
LALAKWYWTQVLSRLLRPSHSCFLMITKSSLVQTSQIWLWLSNLRFHLISKNFIGVIQY